MSDKKVVFTNGCFDILHPGHIDLLRRARNLGEKLVVGINSDESVRAIKGAPRPFLSEEDRRKVLLGLESVDEVRIFSESTPENLIREIKPDILVKGGDWAENEIVGADFVKKNGGEVFSLPLIDGYSSSSIVEKIQTDKSAGEKAIQRETKNTEIIKKSLQGHIDLFETVLRTELSIIEECAELIFETLENGKKILICGNGGSAA